MAAEDTVFLGERSLPDPAVVGAENPRRSLKSELLTALPAALGEGPSQGLVGPQLEHPRGHLLGVVGVEDKTGVADQIGQASGRRADYRQLRRERLADRQSPAFEEA